MCGGESVGVSLWGFMCVLWRVYGCGFMCVRETFVVFVRLGEVDPLPLDPLCL